MKATMKLQRIVQRLKAEHQLLNCTQFSGDIQVHGITADSRTAEEGSLFCAYPGTKQDGHDYIDDAIQNGARVVVQEAPCPDHSEADGIIQVKNARLCEAYIAQEFYGHPSQSMNVIGVTGTNGKTTTAYMIQGLLEGLGETAGLAGSVHHKFGERIIPSDMTTPGPTKLHSLLDRMQYNGCDWAVLEVSSHALDQHRVDAVSFDAAVFTNISRDHLDYHGSMESYRDTKTRLFSMLDQEGIAVVNADDSSSSKMLEECPGKPVKISLNEDQSDYRASIFDQSLFGSSWFLSHENMASRIRSRFPWKYNVENATAAIATVHQLIQKTPSFDRDRSSRDVLQNISSSMSRIEPVPGRMDPVRGPGDVNVFVDFAHTPEALENVLSEAEPCVPGQLRAVFGAGGNRDRGKRPRMGKAVEQFADVLYITSDNPRSEDPMKICKEVQSGLSSNGDSEAPAGQTVIMEPDRRKAIEQAITEASAGDVILILGKGHESFQQIDGREIPFNDKQVARSILEGNAELKQQNPRRPNLKNHS